MQQALLPILEGVKVEVALSGRSRMSSSTESVFIDTSNILFICGGAFPALENIIRSRLAHHMRMGFVQEDQKPSVDERNILCLANAEDLEEFGLIPEFIGRMQVKEVLQPLSVDTFRRILTDPEDAIVKQCQKLFDYDGIELVFEDSALDYLAEKASACRTGARVLREVMEETLERVMYDAPSAETLKCIIITREFASGTAEEPDAVYGGQKTWAG